MQNPNQKLIDALGKFFTAKVSDFKQKYNLNQTVMFTVHSASSWADMWYLKYNCNTDEWSLYTEGRNKEDRRNGLVGFYTHYAEAVKHLDKLQKEEDDLFRAVARFENREKPATDFAL